MEFLVNWFRCPYCRGALVGGTQVLQCTHCARSWPVDGGVPSFMVEDGPIDTLTPKMASLTQRAKQVGWRQALATHFSEDPRQSYHLEYASSEARADFRFIIPHSSASLVLDIGSGWGNIATAFARDCAAVIAIDIDRSNLHFIQVRAEQEGLKNIIPAHANVLRLPLGDESFDVALMVGVLEWVPFQQSGNPQVLQQKALTEVCRVLKPGGYLYLAIENRWSFKYFLGSKEPHTGLRFVSLLPFPLANSYSLMARGRPYRERTYSLFGLNRLLKNAGFRSFETWIPVPGYQVFRFLLNLSHPAGAALVRHRLPAHPAFPILLKPLLHVVIRLGLLKYFAPCFSILAQK